MTMQNNAFIITTIMLLTVSCSAQSKLDKMEASDLFRVIKIVDGDTFWVDDGTERGLKVRLIGVDAPESRNSGKKMKTYFGAEATEYLSKLINGKKVMLEYDIDRQDQYGRTLAYAYTENGTFVNASLVKNGYAMVMTTPPNVRYAETFVELARKARKHGRGLWKGADIQMP